MKMMRRVLVLAGVAMALTACQNSGAEDPSTDDAAGSEDSTAATWHLVNNDVTAESTLLEIGVMRIECAGGETGRVLSSDITYNDDQIIIEALVETLPDGAYTCPSNNVVPIEVHLDEPVGDRELVDGICHPPGGSGDCSADGVRWPLP